LQQEPGFPHSSVILDMNQVEIFQARDKQTQIEVKFEEDTVWLTQQQMADLFKQTKRNISLHLNYCYREKELSKKVTVKNSLIVQNEGNRMVTTEIEYYNLDAIHFSWLQGKI
jgi:hypothetical protein